MINHQMHALHAFLTLLPCITRVGKQ